VLTRRRWLGLALSLPLLPGVARAKANLTIFAAASLKGALDDVAAAWSQAGGKAPPRLSYAASSALAKQLEQGAPADIFIAADRDWMNHVATKELIDRTSRFDLLGNQIVLIAPKDAAIDSLAITREGLAAALAGGRLAMANVQAVPAGKYGKAALETLGVWPMVKDRIAQAENPRAALLLVARGEATLGLVYRTDALAESQVRIVASFPERSHPPIIYPAALVRASRNADARAFLDFLRSDGAKAIFEKHGFAVLAKVPSST